MRHSYGVLWNIVGATVTKFGFAITNQGFHLRIKETEITSQVKEALLFLAKDVGAMMRFLRLDMLRYERGFDTMDDLF